MIFNSFNVILDGIIKNIASVILVSWWVVMPLALGFLAWYFWLYFIYIRYLKSIKWVLLELKIPATVEKSPKAMENVFAAVYGIFSFGMTFRQKYIEGQLSELWMSFEIVGFAGGVHFYIRTPDSFRNLVESAVYAQYPDAEVHEAQDYLSLFPRTLPNKVYDIFGIDYHLIKDNAYPIKTHEYWEEAQEEKRLDPIAALTEAMSKLKTDEAICVQMFVSPVGDDWKKKGEELRDKLIGRKSAKKRGPAEKIFEFTKNLTTAAIEHPAWAEEEKKPEGNLMMGLTTGEKDVIEAIERKISQLGFMTNIRFLYVDKRESFTRSNIAAVMATFHQFSTQNLNGFRPNVDTMTIIRGNLKLSKERRLWHKKRKMWESYVRMYWPKRTSILNLEELATLYHFPTLVVQAPLLRRLGAKKGEPPAGLPVE